MKNSIKITSRPASPKQVKTRVYVHVTESAMQNLENRHSRNVQSYREIAQEAIASLTPRHVKLTWSQKAGCGCGCSPGFIADGPIDPAHLYPRDIHITVLPVQVDVASIGIVHTGVVYQTR